MATYRSHEPAVAPASGRENRRSILFATISAGGSHVSTAAAMCDALERRYPGRFHTAVREPMRDYGFVELDRRHKEGWRNALRHPWTIVWGQKLIDSLPRATLAFHRRLLGAFAQRAAAELSALRPDLVVANHGWLAVALTMAQRHYGLSVPVVTFETSTLNANALWAEPNAERFVVASHDSRERLVRFGIPRSRIDVVGYPVRGTFLCAPGRSQARRLLGLEDRFTCLVALGGEGVGGAPERALSALAAAGDVQVVVITGRNEELRRHLEGFGERLPGLRVLGFVEEMALYLAASDLVVGKSGPATVYETLAVGRPLLVPMRYGSAENRMLALLESNGLGSYVPRSEDLIREVRSYRAEPDRLARVERRAAEMDFPGMADRLARYLAHYAETGRPAAEACGPGLPLSPETP